MRRPRPARAPAPTTPASGSATLWVTLTHAAWMAIALGLLLQAIALLLIVGSTGNVETVLTPANMVQNLAWSELVCVGLALGTAASQARASFMGLAGLLSAPGAFTIARAAQRGVSTIQGAVDTGGSPVVLLGLVKAVEYGLLGVLIGRLSTRRGVGVSNYVLVGLGVGIVFGSMALAAQGYGDGQLPAAKLVYSAVNEILFPAGCALVIYISTHLGKRAAVKGTPSAR